MKNDHKSYESTVSDRDSEYDHFDDGKDLPGESFGDTDDDGDTPLLAKNASAATYDTTHIGGSHHSNDDKKEDDGELHSDLSSDDEDDSEERENIMKELEDIQRLQLQTQDLEAEAKELVNKIPRWFMLTSVVFFGVVGVTTLVAGFLYAFNSIPGASAILQDIVVGLALGGNGLGSLALFYSGSFKTELKDLVKGIKKLEFASDKLKSNVRVLTKHRSNLTKTHQVLKSEIKKLKDEIEKFESNKQLINGIADRIGENTKALQFENENIKREKDQLRDEESRYDESAVDMDDNTKLVETYNVSAADRVKDLSNLVVSLNKTVPKLQTQLDRFDVLREDVKMASEEMGAEVNQTTITVEQIFDEIRELTIRQERVMLYQLMERIMGTNDDARDMGHDQFRRFLLQIPAAYVGHKFDDQWFGEVSVEGRIGHAQLKMMVDTITLKKVSKQISASQKMA